MTPRICISAAALILLFAAAPLCAGGREVATEWPLTAITADDGSLDLSRFHGRVVYLDFWASWCRPCRRSFEWMERMHTAYADRGLVIIAVNVDRDRERAVAFLQRAGAGFPVVFDGEATLAQQLALDAMPSSFLFGPDGSRVAARAGFRADESDEMEREIVVLLESAGAPGAGAP